MWALRSCGFKSRHLHERSTWVSQVLLSSLIAWRFRILSGKVPDWRHLPFIKGSYWFRQAHWRWRSYPKTGTSLKPGIKNKRWRQFSIRSLRAAVWPDGPARRDSGIDLAGNDWQKALTVRAYHEATDSVRLFLLLRPGESSRRNYDSRSTLDLGLDRGSTPLGSTERKSNRTFSRLKRKRTAV